MSDKESESFFNIYVKTYKIKFINIKLFFLSGMFLGLWIVKIAPNPPNVNNWLLLTASIIFMVIPIFDMVKRNQHDRGEHEDS